MAGRHPIIVLWTTPRSRSTAFERMMIERGDHTVFDEPFSVRYYYSAERRSSRFAETLPRSDAAAVVDRVTEAAATRPVFVKDMAYHAAGLLDARLLSRFTNTFLVREPSAALASFARMWPDLTEEEAGYARLAEAYEVAARLSDDPPPVLEADALALDPLAMVAAWCDAVGIEFLPGALTWSPGPVEQWELWREWYVGVTDSTGFQPPTRTGPVALDDPRLADLATRCRPVYERLAAVSLGGPKRPG